MASLTENGRGLLSKVSEKRRKRNMKTKEKLRVEREAIREGVKES